VIHGTFSTNALYRAIEAGSMSRRAEGQYKNIMQLNKERIQYTKTIKHSSAWALWRWSLATVRLPRESF